MTNTSIVPIAELTRRMPEMGRLRFGKQVPTSDGKKMRPKAIPMWRLTAPNEDVIRQAAELWGGTAQPWVEPKANPQNQWEVYVETAWLPIYLPPAGLSVWYELWSGGGCARRCDGVTVEVPGQNDMVERPCICVAKQVKECNPKLRLPVILPDLPFAGAWRMETSSWNAVKELPGMVDMIVSLQERGGMAKALIGLEQRTDMQNGKRRHFIVPKLAVANTPMEMLEGATRVQVLASAPAVPALPAATEPTVDDGRDWFDPDDDIVDAEIIGTEPGAPGPVVGGDGTGGAPAHAPSPEPPPASSTEPEPVVGAGSAAAGGSSDPPPTTPAAPSPDDAPSTGLAGRAKRRAGDPAQAKLVIESIELGRLIELDPGELRHAIAFYVSKGATHSSTELDREAKGKAIDLAIALREDLPRVVRMFAWYQEQKEKATP